MKKLLILLGLGILVSCADQNKRMEYLKKTYPNSKVEPATGLVQQNGYEFIVIDSTNQIIGVAFYPFSESKISSFRNIR